MTAFPHSFFVTFLLLIVCLTTTTQAVNQTYPIDQVFVIDLQGIGLDNATLNDLAPGALDVILQAFGSVFGDYVQFSANTTRRRLREDSGQEEEYDARAFDEYEYEYDERMMHHKERRLFGFNTCPRYCRQYPYHLGCHNPLCVSHGTPRRRRLSSNATFSFDLDAAKAAMAAALQSYVASTPYQLQTTLATQQDYTAAVAKWDFPVVGCVTEYFGPLCSFRTYFGYPDTLYISYWYVNQTSGSVVDVNAYFSKIPSEYLRTLFIMSSDLCQAAIESTFGQPNFCKSCTVLTNTTFDVDCSNLYTDLGIVEFGHLYKGAHDPNATLFPSFFPMQVYQSWLSH